MTDDKPLTDEDLNEIEEVWKPAVGCSTDASDAVRLVREVRRNRVQLDCYRATRTHWPFSVREAIARGDVEAVKADALRAEAVIGGWLRDSHALAAAQERLRWKTFLSYVLMGLLALHHVANILHWWPR